MPGCCSRRSSRQRRPSAPRIPSSSATRSGRRRSTSGRTCEPVWVAPTISKSSTGSSARRTPSSISRLSSAINTRTARSSVFATVSCGPAPSARLTYTFGSRAPDLYTRSAGTEGVLPRVRAVVSVATVLSRWFGRRVPLDPARLAALTAQPGCVLPHSITVIHQELGELDLPEGRVVACDPQDPGVPLARLFPPRLFRARLRPAALGGRDRRTAAFLFRAGAAPPVRWEQDVHELGVDSATGCLAGPQALAELHTP